MVPWLGNVVPPHKSLHAHAQGGGKVGNDWRWRILAVSFVVVDGPLRTGDALGQVVLSPASFKSKTT